MQRMAFQTKLPFVPGSKRGISGAEAAATEWSVNSGTAVGLASLVRFKEHVNLGGGSDILFYPKFFDASEADQWLRVLDKQMPWSRPSLFVYGRPCTQPRESCYVADRNLPVLKYSGHEPVVYHWDDYPVLQCILDAVHTALPETTFNSVLLNRYANGSDYAAWHSDNEKLYGPSPVIASVSLGTERDFLVRMKKSYRVQMEMKCSQRGNKNDDCSHGEWGSALSTCHRGIDGIAKLKDTNPGGIGRLNDTKGNHRAVKSRRLNSGTPSVHTGSDESSKVIGASLNGQHSFALRHGSLFVMKGNMQRDWDHSIPKRVKAAGLRINLTFRKVYGVKDNDAMLSSESLQT